jgi:hypothetical protein
MEKNNKKRVTKTVGIVIMILAMLSLFIVTVYTPVGQDAVDSIIDVITPDNATKDYYTCEKGIQVILEDEEYLTQVPGTLIWQRGGDTDDQFKIDFATNSMSWGQFQMNYYLNEYKYYYLGLKAVDPTFITNTKKEQIARVKAFYENNPRIVAEYFGNSREYWLYIGKGTPTNPEKRTYEQDSSISMSFEPYLESFNTRLASIGCSLKNQDASIMATYKTKKVSTMDYFKADTLIHDPLEVMGTGLDGIANDQNIVLSKTQGFVLIDDYKDVKVTGIKTMADGTKKNVGYFIVAYDNSYFDMRQNVAQDYWHMYDADKWYQFQLNGGNSNFGGVNSGLFVQFFFRDLYMKYAKDDAPLVYFINIDTANNRTMVADNTPCTTNSITLANTHCSLDGAVYQYYPDGETGVRYEGWAWIGMDKDLTAWLAHYMDTSKFADDFFIKYNHIFDVDWQRDYGVREAFLEKYGL